MRKWDKVINKYTGVEAMLINIDEDLDLVTIRLNDTNEEKTLSIAQYNRYWEVTYAIQKSGPKPKVRHGPKPKPKKPGPTQRISLTKPRTNIPFAPMSFPWSFPNGASLSCATITTFLICPFISDGISALPMQITYF